ncbi:MAG: hypothetical protein ABI652_02245 [Acidobacteriota bacterium]
MADPFQRTPAAGATREPPRLTGRSLRARYLALSLASVLVGALGFAWFHAASTSVDSIAVATFVIAHESRTPRYLAEGIPQTLAKSLSRVAGLRVIAIGANPSAGPGVSGPPPRGEMKARAVLRGLIAENGGRIVIDTEVTDAATGRVISIGHYDRPSAELLDLQDAVALDVFLALRPHASADDRTRVGLRYTQSAEAYRLLLEGRGETNVGSAQGYSQATDRLRQAVRVDPHYALAYATLAEYEMRVAAYRGEVASQARVDAEHAVALDPMLAEGHIALGLVKIRLDWDWPGAERAIKRGLELAPTSALAHDRYAAYLATLGRVPDTIVEAKRAQELQPASAVISGDLGWFLLFSGQYVDAVSQFRKTLAIDAHSTRAFEGLGIALSQSGRHDEAIVNLRRAFDLSEKSAVVAGHLGAAYARKGNKVEAQAAIRSLEILVARGAAPASSIAEIYAALGDKNRALAWLDRASAARDFSMADIAVAPWFRPLRTDVRFQKIVGRLNLKD